MLTFLSTNCLWGGPVSRASPYLAVAPFVAESFRVYAPILCEPFSRAPLQTEFETPDDARDNITKKIDAKMLAAMRGMYDHYQTVICKHKPEGISGKIDEPDGFPHMHPHPFYFEWNLVWHALYHHHH